MTGFTDTWRSGSWWFKRHRTVYYQGRKWFVLQDKHTEIDDDPDLITVTVVIKPDAMHPTTWYHASARYLD
jgi:hypothetical protein